MGQLNSILKWINDNQWLNLIFLLLAITSILVSFYLYVKSKKKKKPQYSKRSINILSDRLYYVSDIEVLYQGRKIDNLTITKIAIWNDGNDTILYSDLASSDRLSIITKDNFKIFNSEVIQQTNSTNKITSTIINNVVEITFDYLDQNQGGVIKIIHSGKNSSDINITGTFKGVGKIKEINTPVHTNIPIPRTLFYRLSIGERKKALFFTYRVFPLYMTIIGLAFIISNLFNYNSNTISTSERIFTNSFAILAALAGIANLIYKINILPNNFETFYDDE